MGQLPNNTLDSTVTLGHSRPIITLRHCKTEQFHQDTVDKKIKLGHSRWDNYLTTQQTPKKEGIRQDRTQKIGQLHQDTVEVTVTLGCSRQESYIRRQWDGTVKVDWTITLAFRRQWTGKLYYNAVDGTVTVDWTITLGFRTQLMGQLHQDTVDKTATLHQYSVDGRIILGHSR